MLSSKECTTDFETVGVDELRRTSGLGQLNYGVDGFELCAGVVDLHLPVHAALDSVDLVVPSRRFLAKFLFAPDAATSHVLARQATQFVFGDVQAAAVFWGIVEFDTTHQ